ncbi:precorrin 6A synthase [Salipiger aestuarii]|uniref:Precorrin-6A synthase [deacetylating] n=1 Tax=Salipiger aestuarii TaxID=568098 RepID=A0A327Y4L8_9RHOB|nr:precorrin-6A synthase (deacetylating) [Salipiger aestuarii]KAB2541092.1 precorrin 6A synthase [Salipiger aestuarii]RAK13329.1 precorrin-6A synthase (deacetylating) [Salipiger aestuarii]
MMTDLWLIGMGTGSPAHVTLEGMQALRDAAVILLPLKGESKEELAALRYAILHAANTSAEIRTFDYPLRDPALPYADRVRVWHDAIAARWMDALGADAPRGPVALLVWGDPSLYDSTLRIARRLIPPPTLRVVPGITAVQALTAAHAIPLSTLNGPVRITTGRQLRAGGWPDDPRDPDCKDTLVVMLDSDCSFRALDPVGLHIWWGAHLGSPAQVLRAGPVAEVADDIVATRADSRARAGWIMDTYLLRRRSPPTR